VDDTEGFAVQLQWVGDMTSPPTPVNQILVSTDSIVAGSSPDLHFLNFGFVSPPPIPGEITPEQVQQLQSQPLPVVPVGRFAISTSRLREFRDVLTQHLEKNTGRP
tara:strand:+ start:499 stop:816 length:318 start_codon:yes stop_codon:yes gene_type:complete